MGRMPCALSTFTFICSKSDSRLRNEALQQHNPLIRPCAQIPQSITCSSVRFVEPVGQSR